MVVRLEKEPSGTAVGLGTEDHSGRGQWTRGQRQATGVVL